MYFSNIRVFFQPIHTKSHNTMFLATWSFSRSSFLKGSDLRLLATNLPLKPPAHLGAELPVWWFSHFLKEKSVVVAQTISTATEIIQLNLPEVNERDCRSRFVTRLMALASREAIIIELHASGISSHQRSWIWRKNLWLYLSSRS